MESFYITFNIMVHSQCSHQISFQHLATFLNQQALKNPLLTIGLTSTVARFSTGSVHLCKPRICWNSAVLRLWLGLGTKKNHLVRVTKPSCFSLKYLILSPQTRLKNVPIIHLKKKTKNSGFMLQQWNGVSNSGPWLGSQLAVILTPHEMKVSSYTCNLNVIWPHKINMSIAGEKKWNI